MKLALTNFSLKHPWIVILIVLLVSIFFLIQFPKVKFDNDPENMLSEDEYIRVFHNQVKDKYSLYDFVIVGIVNNTNNDGIFNVETLSKIHNLTKKLISLHISSDKKPAITNPETDQEEIIDLSPESTWRKFLNFTFRHDPNRLFDNEGNSAVIVQEIISPSVVDNIKQDELGSLKLEYLMENAPRSKKEALEIRNDAMSNPLYKGTLVSEDGKEPSVFIYRSKIKPTAIMLLHL
ncbi:MAG: hypothetical protein P9M03_01160 [Candidatus Theseobacter exili]|nr:hypothetical protein [Candidatus Theseobacter exili]